MKQNFFLVLLLITLNVTAQKTRSIGVYDVPNECPDETAAVNGDFAPTEKDGRLSDNLDFFFEQMYYAYDKIMETGGTYHDQFGKRSIDMFYDILSGDMALTKNNYKWFEEDEKGNTLNYRYQDLWYYYYRYLYTLNKGILDFPSAKSEEPAAFAQLMGLRGYLYSRMAFLWMQTDAEEQKADMDALIGPIYTEENIHDNTGVQRKSCADFYRQAIKDLEGARSLLMSYEREEGNKLYLDKFVLSGLLAQTYLNLAVFGKEEEQNNLLKKALDYAVYVMDNSSYSVLPASELLTNGFNDIKSKNWMWGLDGTEDNSGGLKSFFGHVDIYSYSYAWAGDTKVIDYNLYSMMPDWDKRRLWFNTGESNSTYRLCPDKKFFSAINNTQLDEESLDHQWLSDDVYMRYESILLIAAEAAYRMGNYTASADYLKEITSRRINLDDFEAEDDYNDFVAGLSDAARLRNAIIYNWRVEMWGEGYGWETALRFRHKRIRGINHLTMRGAPIIPEQKMNTPESYTHTADNITHEHIIGQKATITVYVNDCPIPQKQIECMIGDYVGLFAYKENQGMPFSHWSGTGLNEELFILYFRAECNDIRITAHYVPTTDMSETETECRQDGKLLKNGQLYIRRDGRTYNSVGQEVR